MISCQACKPILGIEFVSNIGTWKTWLDSNIFVKNWEMYCYKNLSQFGFSICCFVNTLIFVMQYEWINKLLQFLLIFKVLFFAIEFLFFSSKAIKFLESKWVYTCTCICTNFFCWTIKFTRRKWYIYMYIYPFTGVYRRCFSSQIYL